MTTAAAITKLDSIRAFVLAGNATFTLRSKLTGEHRTYHVEKGTASARFPIPTWFVKQLVGPGHYEYIGYLRCSVQDGSISYYAKHETPGTAGFRWLLSILNNLVEPMVAENFARCADFMHEGRCGVCGRPLTNPESIETGIGPTCTERA